MVYTRPQNLHKLTKVEKVSLLEEYVAYYEQAIKEQGIEAINIKIPREAFLPTLDKIGEMLLFESESLLQENSDIQAFLKSAPLPPHMAELLPDKFRVFSLLLNALKQWVSAESAATDRYLLGGTARNTCREAVTHCIVTGELLGDGAELHHPVRDGRPPILLSKNGHEKVERSVAGSTSVANSRVTNSSAMSEEENCLWEKLQSMRSQRNKSWAQLREGCSALFISGSTCRPNAKSFANVVVRETGKSPQEIIEFLDFVGK